jgi:hypothetical protein
MASTHLNPSGVYSISFRYAGRQFMKSLKTKSQEQANRQRVRIEGTLLDMERGRLVLPEGAELWQFVLSDGRRTHAAKIVKAITLGNLFVKYFEGLRVKEENTINTERIHRRHFERLLGANRPLVSLTSADIQGVRRCTGWGEAPAKTNRHSDHPKGDRHLAHVPQPSRETCRDEGTRGAIQEPRLPEGQREAAVPDMGRDRAAGRCWCGR